MNEAGTRNRRRSDEVWFILRTRSEAGGPEENVEPCQLVRGGVSVAGGRAGYQPDTDAPARSHLEAMCVSCALAPPPRRGDQHTWVRKARGGTRAIRVRGRGGWPWRRTEEQFNTTDNEVWSAWLLLASGPICAGAALSNPPVKHIEHPCAHPHACCSPLAFGGVPNSRRSHIAHTLHHRSHLTHAHS